MVNTLPTSKGHLDQERDNLQSTKQTTEDNNEDFNPPKGKAQKTKENITKLYPSKETTYLDQTG